MTVSFDTAFDRLLGAEGGYVNDPADPGGETKWGISKRSYPTLSIINLTRNDAKVIYERDFWNGIGEATPPAVRFQVFDFAVNGGLSVAVRKLQSAVGVADDGHWGPVSDKAIATMELNDIILRFNAQRIRFYTSLSQEKKDRYLSGWMNRVAANLDYASQDN